jgi:SpoVK/Ycf46/Vps4 family AAA+-type ATPase
VQDLEGASLLWDCLDDYRYIIEHPEVLTAVKGNEVIKSGILLAGLPGVGKTFLYECLKTELGVDGFELSPKNKDPGTSMLDSARKILKQAKDCKKPCILFIDEPKPLLRIELKKIFLLSNESLRTIFCKK